MSYLFGIARTRTIHPKIQINSLHFQSFKALNLIWSQKKKKKKKRVSKLLKKHFKSIKFLFFFQIFRDYKGGVGVSDQIWKIPDFFFFEAFPNCIKTRINIRACCLLWLVYAYKRYWLQNLFKFLLKVCFYIKSILIWLMLLF